MVIMNESANTYKESLDSGEKTRLPFLFKASISTELGKDVSFYLLGSQHDLPRNYVAHSIGSLLNNCDILIKEIISGSFGDASDITVDELRLHGLSFDKNACDWTAFLSTEAQEHFEIIKNSIKTAWNIEPHQISPVVVEHVVSDWALSNSYGEGMDTYIENQFISAGKPVFPLENGKIRFDSYNSLFHLSNTHRQNSLQKNTASLEATILSWAKGTESEQRDDFIEYFSGEIPESCSFDRSESLCKRNLVWLSAMQGYLRRFPDQTILFLFGYAHLGGPYGILTLLKYLGFDVKKCDQSL